MRNGNGNGAVHERAAVIEFLESKLDSKTENGIACFSPCPINGCDDDYPVQFKADGSYGLCRQCEAHGEAILEELWWPDDSPTESGNHSDATSYEEDTSWAPIDLTPYLSGENPECPPSILSRVDGKCLLYKGKVHSLDGESESGKSWVALLACKECIRNGLSVVYLDFEDGAPGIVGRLLNLGLEIDEIQEHFTYVRPDEALSTRAAKEKIGLATEGRALAIIDGLTEAFTLHGFSIGDNNDIAKWLALLPNPLALRGTAVLQLDHLTKNPDDHGKGGIGGQHKRSGVHCVYRVKAIIPFGRGQSGRLEIHVGKDRPGFVRGFALDGKVADVEVHCSEGGVIDLRLEIPTERKYRPKAVMEKVSKLIEENVGINTNAVKNSGGDGKANVSALKLLVEEGYVEATPQGQAKTHCSKIRYRVEDDPDEQDALGFDRDGISVAQPG